jgi:hypothetical protein
MGNGYVMPLSYWDRGFIQPDATNPANPTVIGDTDYTNRTRAARERRREPAAQGQR